MTYFGIPARGSGYELQQPPRIPRRRAIHSGLAAFKGREHHINIRILQTIISGILLILGVATRMSDPCVYVVFWDPSFGVPRLPGSS